MSHVSQFARLRPPFLLKNGLVRLLFLLFFGVVLWFGHHGAVWAVDVAPSAVSSTAGTAPLKANPNPELFDPLSSSYLLKLISSLVIVLGLMFVVVWLLKRTGRFNGQAGRYPLSVLAQMSVGTRERVLLISVGDRQMLLGVSQGHIKSLGWVDPPLSPDDVSKPVLHEGPFSQLLKNHMPQVAPTSKPKKASEQEGAANETRS